jgi:hypothetical protein
VAAPQLEQVFALAHLARLALALQLVVVVAVWRLLQQLLSQAPVLECHRLQHQRKWQQEHMVHLHQRLAAPSDSRGQQLEPPQLILQVVESVLRPQELELVVTAAEQAVSCLVQLMVAFLNQVQALMHDWR